MDNLTFYKKANQIRLLSDDVDLISDLQRFCKIKLIDVRCQTTVRSGDLSLMNRRVNIILLIRVSDGLI